MDTMPSPRADFEITPADWEEVNAAHLFASPLFEESARNIRVIVTLLFLTLAALVWVIGSPFTAIALLVAAPAVVAAVGPLVRHGQKASLRKLCEQGISNGTFGPHTVEIRDEGLWHATDAFESLIRWHAIERVEEMAGHFFIYTGPNAFLPVPVTAFRDAELMRRFSDAFYERIASARAGGTDGAPFRLPDG